jgi:hypothetical protein
MRYVATVMSDTLLAVHVSRAARDVHAGRNRPKRHIQRRRVRRLPNVLRRARHARRGGEHAPRHGFVRQDVLVLVCVAKMDHDQSGAVDTRHGKAKAGVDSKPQLRINEVRRYTDVALYLCQYGTDALSDRGGRPNTHGIGGPAAALAVFYLVLRADEVASVVVRDLDDHGTLLWVPKTEAGKRALEVPELLQPIFQHLAKGELPTAKLCSASAI